MMKPIVAAALFALAGCGFGPIADPRPTISASQQGLTAAGKTILGCYQVAACSAAAPHEQIKTAFDKATDALDAAQDAADKGATPEMSAVSATMSILLGLVAKLPTT